MSSILITSTMFSSSENMIVAPSCKTILVFYGDQLFVQNRTLHSRVLYRVAHAEAVSTQLIQSI
jgi:hypothetical protein